MNRFAVGNPRPEPRDFVVKNGTKISSRIAEEMPGPESATEMRHTSPPSSIDTRTQPSPATAWAAFNITFTSTTRRRSGIRGQRPGNAFDVASGLALALAGGLGPARQAARVNVEELLRLE